MRPEKELNVCNEEKKKSVGQSRQYLYDTTLGHVYMANKDNKYPGHVFFRRQTSWGANMRLRHWDGSGPARPGVALALPEVFLLLLSENDTTLSHAYMANIDNNYPGHVFF